MKILIASKNQHKIKEMKKILERSRVETISLLEFDDDYGVAETGKTFSENAVLKAVSYAKHYQMPVIADDSGISVVALNHRPGVYSARYSEKGDDENNRKILLEMQDNDLRDAYYTCVIAVAFPNGYHRIYEGIWHGSIVKEPRGHNGFGYDPLFYIKEFDKTAAQLSEKQKNQYSHRAKALSKLKEDLDEITNYR